MNLRKYFTLLFIVLTCLLTCAQSRMSRGNASKIEDSPHLTSIYYADQLFIEKYYCAGALVTMQMVVTSGRCVHQLNDKEITVVAGSTKLYGEEHVRKVNKIFMPLSYSFETGNMDIAVLEVNKPFDQGRTIDKIPLCTAQLTAYTQMRVSGWGEAKADKNANKVLRSSFVPIILHGECVARFKGTNITVEQSMVCSGGRETGAHFGGSGAPGAVSRQLCAIALAKQKKGKFPHLYTDLSNSKVQRFVQSTINGKCCSKSIVGKHVTKIFC